MSKEEAMSAYTAHFLSMASEENKAKVSTNPGNLKGERGRLKSRSNADRA